MLVLFLQLIPGFSLQALDDYANQHRSLQDSSSSLLLLRKPFLYPNWLPTHRRMLLLSFGSYTATQHSLGQSFIQVCWHLAESLFGNPATPNYSDFIRSAGEPSRTNGLSSKEQHSPH